MRKAMLIGALMITFPAIAALIYGIFVGHRFIVMAASVSLGLNVLPFLAAALLMGGKGEDADLSH